MRELAFDLGLGMMLFESSWLAVKLSFLPNFTSQDGPPLCLQKKNLDIDEFLPMEGACIKGKKIGGSN